MNDSESRSEDLFNERVEGMIRSSRICLSFRSDLTYICAHPANVICLFWHCGHSKYIANLS